MNLSKTTINFAEKRNIDLILGDTLWIHTDLDGNEPVIIYAANDDGSFQFKTNISLCDSIKEELPAYIRDEKHLREVIAFIAKEVA